MNDIQAIIIHKLEILLHTDVKRSNLSSNFSDWIIRSMNIEIDHGEQKAVKE